MTNHVYLKFLILLDKVNYNTTPCSLSLGVWNDGVFPKTAAVSITRHYFFPIEEYTALRDQWIRDGQGFLLVYSISSRSTFERVPIYRDQILRVKEYRSNIPMILVGNMCDKITEREVSREEGLQMGKKLGCEFIETSAKTCVNIERSFYTVVRMIRRTREDSDQHGRSKKKNKKKCPIL